MKLKKIVSVAMSVLMLASVATIGASAASDTSANPYEVTAASYDEKAYYGDDLGVTINGDTTTFKLWSPAATAVDLQIYENGSIEEDVAAEGASSSTQPMAETEEGSGLWTITINGNLNGSYYVYSVKSEEYPNGIETVDPYAKAVGVNGNRGMILDLSETDPQGWDQDSFERVENQSDANVWELHIKDFSYDENSGISEANRGKYLAFTETDTTLKGEGEYKTGVSYIKDMGYNYVHLNPFYDYGSIDEAGEDTQFNWGYDPKNYNVPEGSYSSNPYDGAVRINETKQMIQSLHNEGIGVIMDVVYNHTYVQDSWLQKAVPNYYYRIKANGEWSNGSGCGNDTASEREMFRKYMVDSIVYWAKEYHIDGFRFDLMGLHDVETMNAIRDALDEIDEDIIMYGEGWTMGSEFDSDSPAAATQANSAKMSNRISFFNDQLRDGIKGSVFDEFGKGFVQGSKNANTIALGLLANTTGGNWKAQQPEQTVSYASCHDNATLYDRLVNSLGGDFTVRYDDYVQRNKLSAAIVYGSQGTSFVLAGEEFARTKLGDHNSYKSAADLNMLDWERTVEYADLVSYYKGLIEFRNAFDPVRTPTKLANATTATTANTVSVVYKETGAAWDTVAMLFNNAETEQTVNLSDDLPTEWVVLVNDQRAGTEKLAEINGPVITVPAKSALYLVDKASYEAAGVSNEKAVVEVQHINSDTDEVMNVVTITGEVGETYTTFASTGYDLYYNFVKVEGTEKGTFTQEKTTVKYYYEPNLLRPKDVNGDGPVDLKDVVILQKHIAEILTLTGENFTNADVDRNGVVDLKDVIYYQKHIAGYEDAIGVATVKVRALTADGTVVDSKDYKFSIGSDYTVEPLNVSYYVLDETNLPVNATGKVTPGTTVVDYFYEFQAVKSTIRVEVPVNGDGAPAWVPNLYIWETGKELAGTWPGKAMTPIAEGSNIFELSFDNGGTYNWIVNSGGAQTSDQVGFSGDLYIVMDDPATVVSVSELNLD